MKDHNQLYHCAIVAVGFGIEKGLEPAVASNSYWMVDSFEQVRPDRPKPYRVLVTGCGDGGLTDLMRLCSMAFRHDEVVASIGQEARAAVGGRRREVLGGLAGLVGHGCTYLSASSR